MRVYLNIVVVAIVTFIYGSIYWLGESNLWQVQRITSLDLYKPWIYRQLVLALARLLTVLGARIDLALVLIVTIAGVCFYLGLRRLIYLSHPESSTSEIITLLSVFFGMLIFGRERVSYDLMTACLFTWALVYAIRDNQDNFTIVFTLACFNRETAFLLVLMIGAIYYVRRDSDLWRLVFNHGVIFVLVQILLRVIFADNGGVVAWVEPLQNIQRFINHPLLSLLHLAVASVMLLFVLKGWKSKSVYLRATFAVFLPVLMVLYLVCGQSFEVRVFWEVYPVTVALCYPQVVQWKHENNEKIQMGIIE